MDPELLELCKSIGSGAKMDQVSHALIASTLDSTSEVDWERHVATYHLTHYGFDLEISLKIGEEKSLIQAFYDKCKELYPSREET